MKPTQWLHWLWSGGPPALGAPAFLPALNAQATNPRKNKSAHVARTWLTLSRSQTGAPPGGRSNQSVQAIPKGLNHSAQRCRDNGAATLGDKPPIGINPERVVSTGVLTTDATLSGLCRLVERIPSVATASQRRADGWNPFRILNAFVRLTVCLLFTAPLAHAQTVATPVISPASGTLVPVSVSISDSTANAVIRYMLDGSLPTLTSPVYYTNLYFTNLTMVRATAFLGTTNSGTAYAYYEEPQTRTDMGYYRTVTNDNGNPFPLIIVTNGVIVTNSPFPPVTCFTIEEQLPASVTPFNIDSGGQWLPNLNVIRWGPFINVSNAVVSYRISGIPGSYNINGLSWADGRWQFVPSTSTATILSTINTSVPVPPSQVAAPVIAPLALPAESAVLGGGAVVSTTNAGYNGTGFVSFPNNGGYLEFDGVNGGEGGTATLLVRYANGASACSGQLVVNGVTNSVMFNSTTTWTNWSLLTNSLALIPGVVNTIRLQSSGSGLANVDEITVTPVNPAVPADVVITCPTPGAAIYYTLDGSLPTTNSTLYTGTFHLANAGVVRACAFLSGWLPSVASLVNYGPAPTVGPATFTRTMQTNVPWAPVMSLSFMPGTGAVCQAYEETVPLNLVITNVSGDGVWSNGVVRWGPYLNTNSQTFSYTALGVAGTYTVSVRWSHDGTGTDMGSTNLVIAGTTNTLVIPVQPSKLPAPALVPAFSATLPASVTITDVVAGVQIYYTTDNSTPSTNSALYSSSLNLTNFTTLRVRAFLADWLPSDSAVGYYGALTNDAGSSVSLVRTIPSNTNAAPQVTLTATPQGSVHCYTVTETVPIGLTPSNLTQNAVWNPANQTLKWGPFTNQSVVMTYQLYGMAGGFVCNGQGSVDGYPWPVTGQSNVVVTSTVDISAPVAPSKLPTPQLTPVNTNALPVTVTASCSVGTAQLCYTLDGSTPTTNSALYASPLLFTTNTILRVRAFQSGYTPSDTAVGYYEPAASATSLIVTRSITNSPGYAPSVALTATPVGNVSSYTVTESVPYGLTPFNVSAAGVWNATALTLKWGPFSNQTQTLTYQVSGTAGTNVIGGSGSVDGFPVAITGNTNIEVDLNLMPNPAAPAITVQPLSQPQAVGYPLVLYVNAIGAPPPSYQWRFNGTNLPGANSQVYGVASFQATNAGNYDVVVANSVGVVTSQVATVTMMMAPVITLQPQPLLLQTGTVAIFNVTASGVPAPTYQWLFNGTNLGNASGSSYLIPGVRPTDAGTYSVVVANSLGTVTSSNAVLTVYATPAASLGLSAAANGILINITGVPGWRYAVQTSTNLTTWTGALTNNAPFTFNDTNLLRNRSLFYRAVYLP
jgi:hypothetical protein